ncbi:MAG: hypothetical protein JWM80_6107 [Cyanobacteria bacterium RYN_339]|nr:hypothetical protein [Cyanobacteria bacterium RYN_339]
MKDLVIVGTGGFAREVHQIVEDLGSWNFLGFLDDNVANHGTRVHGQPVLGGVEWLNRHPEVHVSVGIGATPAKARVVGRIHNPFATLIHPLAWVGNRVAIGEGSTLCAGVKVTTDIRIGRHVILNLDVTVGHDAVLHDYVTVAPSANISGNVEVGEGCDLGTNCTIIQGLGIGAWTIVGAGSVVVKALPPNVTAVGAPARAIKERPEGWHK